MISEQICIGVKRIVGEENVFISEPMKNHTSFRVGGNADMLITPPSVSKLAEAMKHIGEACVPFYIMGNGSNLIVQDNGYRGVIIKILDNISEISVAGNIVTAEAGALISSVSKTALAESLTGLEFAEGIPGTLGGALAMNAGAYGGEMKDVVHKVTAIDNKGNLFELSNEEMALEYRKSILQTKGLTAVKAELLLAFGNPSEIKEKMDYNKKQRTEKQPLEKPSAGSTFKRPKGYFTGKLIMDSGLKGYKIGGASVSEKHCGFVVSDGTATTDDILNLIAHIKSVVYKNYGVTLHEEVKVI